MNEDVEEDKDGVVEDGFHEILKINDLKGNKERDVLNRIILHQHIIIPNMGDRFIKSIETVRV